MFTKSMPFEYKANTAKREFEGYASTYKRDLVGDQVVKGAYKKTLDERLPNGKIKILYQHSDPVGLPLEMYEDSKGLYVRQDLKYNARKRHAGTNGRQSAGRNEHRI
jgi:HK97 family phage prohead protease